MAHRIWTKAVMNLTPLRQILARRPGPATANRRQRTMTAPGRLPRTIQLCIH
jgi:hypothetical protein